MAGAQGHLDCCDAPRTAPVRTYHQGRHDIEALHRCDVCGRHWFYRYSEYVAGDYEDWTVWWSEVPEDLVSGLLGNESPSLAFLKSARTLICDASGVQEGTGQPEAPFG